MIEEWRQSILPYVLVSNLGNFKKVGRYVTQTSSKGTIYKRYQAGGILKPVNNGTGYFQVKIIVDGVKHIKYAHILVYLAFNGDIPEGLEIDHIDNNKANNSYNNLRLLTRKENMKKCLEDNPHILKNLKQNQKL